jgi:hypothetical protein
LDEAKTYAFDLSRVRFIIVFLFRFKTEAHIRANELLVDAGREVAFFFRDMLELGITIM